ncbi:MAG TPA: RNA-binding cell elongation regulator Jag/EloR [Promineifilum sp.]|nr:RNA-binding cell elongation regulator Jag/EloR [Promineifilum sp.]HQF70019.1 RNA-binding cell elongation regulator Jag/EloR [Promineifilum sp.]
MSPSSTHEIESRGANVDAAIDAGLRRLGLARDQVTVTVIDEGSRGLLGIGSREAIVRLSPVAAPPARPAAAPPPVARPAAPAPAARPEPARRAEPPAAPAPAARPEPARRAEPPAAPAPTPSAAAVPSAGEAEEVASADELAEEQQAAVAILSELLEKMHVPASVSATQSEPDDLTGQRVNVIAIHGEDLTMLIGPRGETLDALQFLGRLMVAHELHRRANFVVDVEGYRQRRVLALTRLAERMADKARQRGEPISLEPMTAYERRIIHMALRDAPDVYTESAGEGKQRRVRIYPKAE